MRIGHVHMKLKRMAGQIRDLQIEVVVKAGGTAPEWLCAF
jgi:hypothetical protein